MATPTSKKLTKRPKSARGKPKKVKKGAAPARAVTVAGPAAGTKVTFSNSGHSAVIARIDLPGGSQVLGPSATFLLSAGIHPGIWAAATASGGDFAITVVGGTLSVPIAGTLGPNSRDGGPLLVRVP